MPWMGRYGWHQGRNLGQARCLSRYEVVYDSSKLEPLLGYRRTRTHARMRVRVRRLSTSPTPLGTEHSVRHGRVERGGGGCVPGRRSSLTGRRRATRPISSGWAGLGWALRNGKFIYLPTNLRTNLPSCLVHPLVTDRRAFAAADKVGRRRTS